MMKQLSDLTRTEVFFTSSLHYAHQDNQHAIAKLLSKKLGLPDSLNVTDSCYEVCLFRDLAKAGYITRQSKSLEKQTFDNIFVLSDNSIVLVEAKAQQCFSNSQLNQMKKAREIIMQSSLPWVQVYLVGIISSRYSPKVETINKFNGIIRWSELSEVFTCYRKVFDRADSIYGD